MMARLPTIGRRKREAVDPIANDFKPAAIALEEAPPSRVARGILWSIMAFFLSAVAWASVGRVDVVAVTEGQLVPKGRTNIVQPSQMGRVAQIHIEDGSLVEVGQPLVTLDGTETQAEVTRLQDIRQLTQRRLQRQTLWTEFLQLGLSTNESSEPAQIQLETEDALLSSRHQALLVMDAGLAQRLRARELEYSRTSATVQRLEQTQPLLAEHASAIQALNERDMAPRVELIAMEREIIQMDGQLEGDRLRLIQLEAEIEEIEHQRRQLWTDALERSLTEQESLEAELEDLGQQLVKATSLSEQQVLRAPVSGIIHNLQVNTIGSVVQPAQTLLEIIPSQERVIAEVWVDNRDIGFVNEGQSASLKLNAFAFTRYGTVPGTVTSVSNDAIVDENAGPRYLARIELDQHYIDLGGKEVSLAPGMTLSAEVTTGQRRLIEFFAAPILSALDETGRER
ncbi:HlyD family type I secretion periplasmic adaptor subunit [Natronospirillum operosum]|uniref:Membrane fusion protein (MFP) family protein n=1 Tax=Natronospirillum operosum TaxID=2759953 RepID=A0A4Z0WAY7_9GAMM|nr:HlyD family type I secretion periplasmic adaptor subunit [Natronospirillum operosum]TGG91131.1 HlyD family type I secretion periplasmic adaptor subunit [Natronospirillum operosum]